jgi:hypothetical protein
MLVLVVQGQHHSTMQTLYYWSKWLLASTFVHLSIVSGVLGVTDVCHAGRMRIGGSLVAQEQAAAN